ncbi:MAG: hypothetical protein EOO61_13060 [Hymenobacter sp.]|nr:MAG: hypothetical protein EOO61_13060 [Hymenobacter sp.]
MLSSIPFYWLTLVVAGGYLPLQQAPALRPVALSYSPQHPLKAYTFYATPRLYAHLADTVRPAQHFIYPGGHAYVRGTLGHRWIVISYDSAQQAPCYYLRRTQMVEIAPYIH